MNKIIAFIIFTSLLFLAGCDQNKREQRLLEELQNAKDEQLKTQSKLDDLTSKVEDIHLASTHLPISDLNKLYEKCRKSVYLIVTEDNNQVSQGSAFLIDNNGLALSNFHVFKNAKKAIAVDYEGNRHEIFDIISHDEDKDYVFFVIPGAMAPPVTLAEAIPNVGDQSFAIGNPYGLTQTLSTGIISSFRRNNELIQTSTEITHGSSGGPLFNSIGQVIGITTSGLGEANLNFAINIMDVPFPNKDEVITKNESETGNQIISQGSIEDVVNNYYNLTFSQSWDDLNDLYAPRLDFFKYENITREFAIRDHMNYYKRFTAISHEVIPNSYSQAISNSIINTTTQIRFVIQRNSDGKRFGYLIQSKLKINQQGQIINVNEEILDKW